MAYKPIGIDPPSWFSPELVAIWGDVIANAPPGVLTATDHPAVVTYAVAIFFEHDRMARRIVARKTPAPATLARHLRLLAAEVRAAAKHLGLPPYDAHRRGAAARRT